MVTASHLGLAGLILPSLFLFLTFQKLPQFPDLTWVQKELCFLIFLIFLLKEGSYTNKNVMQRDWVTRILASCATMEFSGLYSCAFPHFEKYHQQPIVSYWFSFTPKLLEKAFFNAYFLWTFTCPSTYLLNTLLRACWVQNIISSRSLYMSLPVKVRKSRRGHSWEGLEKKRSKAYLKNGEKRKKKTISVIGVCENWLKYDKIQVKSRTFSTESMYLSM